MKTLSFQRRTFETGYTLITTMVIAVAAAVLMAGTLGRVYSGSKLNDRNNAYVAGTAAAEAATEKTMAAMMIDFANGGEETLSNNLTYYRTKLLPSSNENSYWTNFVFSDGSNNVNQICVYRVTTNANPPYVTLETQYPGLNAFAATYRIVANATLAPNNTTFGAYYNFTNAVCQDVQMAEIPVFQFAIFYNGLLEFTDCAPLTINGRVQCNSNIYVGCPSSSSTLTFNYMVTASGSITNPSWFGYAQSSYISGNIKYNGAPAPGWGTGEPVLTLPMGAATNSPISIIQLPNASDGSNPSTNALSLQRYYYKADIVILVTNITTTNVAVNLIFKNSMFDSSPLIVSYTNNMPANSTTPAISNAVRQMNTNWAWWFGSTNSLTNWQTSWLTTNATFWDARQGQTNLVTQIDVGKFGTWIATNTNTIAKWTSSNPFNGVIYVADMRTTNGMYMDCVRLTNGQYIPTIGASNIVTSATTSTTNDAYSIPGLTIATINPLYIQGLYNCPTTNNLSSTNVSGTSACSAISDALTILSPAWTDANSWSVEKNGSSSMPTASTVDTVNTAIIAGNVTSTGSSTTQFSGGVHNLTRLLEDWSSSTLWLNTSIINLYASQQATKQFQSPGIYYNAPTRKFSFDLNFQSSTGLPPGTPQVNRMIRADWFTPPPDNDTINPSPTASFVPQ